MGYFSGENITPPSPQIYRIEGFGSSKLWANLPNSLRYPLNLYSSDVLIVCNVGRKRSKALKDALKQIQPSNIANPFTNIGYGSIDLPAIMQGKIKEENGIIRLVDTPIDFNRLVIASGTIEEEQYVDEHIISPLVKNFPTALEQIISIDMRWP